MIGSKVRCRAWPAIPSASCVGALGRASARIGFNVEFRSFQGRPVRELTMATGLKSGTFDPDANCVRRTGREVARLVSLIRHSASVCR